MHTGGTGADINLDPAAVRRVAAFLFAGLRSGALSRPRIAAETASDLRSDANGQVVVDVDGVPTRPRRNRGIRRRHPTRQPGHRPARHGPPKKPAGRHEDSASGRFRASRRSLPSIQPARTSSFECRRKPLMPSLSCRCRRRGRRSRVRCSRRRSRCARRSSCRGTSWTSLRSSGTRRRCWD
ncbi:hypothetical protein SBRY_90109 [Actinacidiphila bryophytorum]|uniref:Uncharacterized protein n=1 Tax=Actinacidiphila bryophytorum TaxID=1436133 RepID=A0A9W4H7M7_9ACTN|nr:hypothetical protein SBRY_90109 [Actinacidiphila bryophytorum]